MVNYANQYYLLIRPVAEAPAGVEPHLDMLAQVTGLDKLTLKQKFSGSSFDVLKMGQDRSLLQKLSEKLLAEGVLATVISKKELRASKSALRATSVEASSSSIDFLSSDSETILSLNGTTSTLIVLTSRSFDKLNSKRVARHSFGSGKPLGVEESLKYLYMSRPLMEIYTKGSEKPILVDSTRFNFTSLGDEQKGSVGLNFPVILERVIKSSGSTFLDIGFGEKNLPFLKYLHSTEKARALRDFETYTAMLRLLFTKGFLNLNKKATDGGTTLSLFSTLLPPPLAELGGLMIGGPIILGKKAKKRKKEHATELAETGMDREPNLPLPPEGSVVYSSSRASWFSRRLPRHFKRLRELGPPALSYPLSSITLASLIFGYITERIEFLSIGLLAFGLLLYTHSFVMLRRKHSIENCPTSKIRSMPMGEIEVVGNARAKYFLRSPYTLTDCVYYRYKVYKTIRTGNNRSTELIAWGSSGNLPFYIEDDTGQVMIEPGEAVMHAGRKERLSGDILTTAGPYPIGGDTYVNETVIPVGEKLFVLGYARRVTLSHVKKKVKVTEKLRQLKHDPARLKRYDTNGDGKISAEEWDKAREDTEDEVLRENLAAKTNEDDIAIGPHPSGGLFFISDKKEGSIISSLTWRIPLTLVVGTATSAAGVYYLQILIKNRTFFMELLKAL